MDIIITYWYFSSPVITSLLHSYSLVANIVFVLKYIQEPSLCLPTTTTTNIKTFSSPMMMIIIT